MKKTLFALFLACMGFAGTASAQTYDNAIGVRLSSAQPKINNSISFKHFLSEASAVEVLFSFGDPVGIGALYEIHKPFGSEGLQWFYGGGGYLAFEKEYNPNTEKHETDTNFGAMGVIGLDYKFVNLPINLSIDWKPELNLVSDINFEPAAIGLTARFTF